MNQALLMAFSANEVPAVSRCRLGPIRRGLTPYHFQQQSYAGRENPEIRKAALLQDLPGIFNRMVNALRAHRERGWLYRHRSRQPG